MMPSPNFLLDQLPSTRTVTITNSRAVDQRSVGNIAALAAHRHLVSIGKLGLRQAERVAQPWQSVGLVSFIWPSSLTTSTANAADLVDGCIPGSIPSRA
jgi:hypothetical protein